MIGALIYLQVTSLKNNLRLRARRLKQPRYAIAAVVGIAYFYFFFLRHFFGAPLHRPPAFVTSGELAAQLLPVGAFLLLGGLLLAWVLPGNRAALRFSEAEIAFLFPAPLSRRSLIHYKLIRSQFAILISALFLALLSRRGAFLGGSWWIHAVGWWLLSSLINLHLLAASFTRERLAQLGLPRWLRAGAGIAVLLGITVVSVRWLGQRLPPLSELDPAHPSSLLNFVDTVLQTPPLSWALWPFRAAVAPLFATSAASFFGAVWIVLLLLLGHYVWVVRSAVAFEEASVSLAARHAARRAALVSGQGLALTPTQRRREPFRLAPRGPAVTAFFWKGLIGVGTKYYPLPWLGFTAVLVGASLWLGLRQEYRPLAKSLMIGAAVIAGYAMLIGPVFFRRTAHRMLEGMDILKSYPLRGWQVVLGQLSLPMGLLTAVQITLSAVVATGFSLNPPGPAVSFPLVGAGALGWCLMAAPLGGLLFAINFGTVLLFPAWAGVTHPGAGGQGVEMLGQRLILFAGYLVILLVALVPAAGLGAALLFPIHWLTGHLALGILAGSLVAAAVLVGELAATVWWLGRRYEHFDLSTEMPR